MPSLFRLFGYVIFFWSNEGAPLEPVHVHVAKGVPNASATKIWITEAGGCIVANNNSKIPARTLNAIVDVLESRSSYIVAQWNDEKTQRAALFCFADCAAGANMVQ